MINLRVTSVSIGDEVLRMDCECGYHEEFLNGFAARCPHCSGTNFEISTERVFSSQEEIDEFEDNYRE